jgi:hypothetical protein
MLVLLVWTHLAAMAVGFILTATYWPADKELKRSYEELEKRYSALLIKYGEDKLLGNNVVNIKSPPARLSEPLNG